VEVGAQGRASVHVKDVASATLAAADGLADLPDRSAPAFNLGSGIVTTLGELAQGLAHAMGGPDPVVTGEYRLGDVRPITASSDRARAELDWVPRVALADGLAEFAAAGTTAGAAAGAGQAPSGPRPTEVTR
jgi:dTDP-L-rhamnose 4-epimerase